MGRSRSTTVLIAYLLSADASLNPSNGLSRIRSSRPFAEPNPGFTSQLELYYQMQSPQDLDSQPIYQRWLYQRTVDASNACGLAPDADGIHFSDLNLEKQRSNVVSPAEDKQSIYRCRRCRTPLATTAYLIPHEPQASLEKKSKSSNSEPATVSVSTAKCAHLFLDPLSWMRPELGKGLLVGRLECPNSKCAQNVGKYAWQGMKCSCGEWIVPGICIARARVDEIPEIHKSNARIERI